MVVHTDTRTADILMDTHMVDTHMDILTHQHHLVAMDTPMVALG